MLRTALHIVLLVSLLALALATGCDRNVEAFDPTEQVTAPDLARIFPPEEAAAAVAAGQGANSPGARGNLPPSRAEAGAPSAAGGGSDGQPVRGTIEVAPALASRVPAGAVLFLMARPAGVASGPPLAVVRVANPSFPLPFELGPENVMLQGMSFSGQMDVTARLDGDGNAMTRDDTDLIGSLGGPVFPGSSGIRLVLDATHGAGGVSAATPATPATPATSVVVAPAPVAAGGGETISGQVMLAPALAAGAPAGGTLFIYARKPGVDRGPPIAVVRVPRPSFPVAFTLGPQNVMIPSMRFAGEMSISARLDGDGNAMTREAGDVTGSVSQALTPGAVGVELLLDEAL